jgi:hypothetical protein
MFDTWILAHFLELDSTVLGRKSAFVHIVLETKVNYLRVD